MTGRDDWAIWDDDELLKGEEVAAYWRARLKTKGALSTLEQNRMWGEVNLLSPKESDQFYLYWERGFCTVCSAAGQVEPAGHGPGGEYCEACAAEVTE